MKICIERAAVGTIGVALLFLAGQAQAAALHATFNVVIEDRITGSLDGVDRVLTTDENFVGSSFDLTVIFDEADYDPHYSPSPFNDDINSGFNLENVAFPPTPYEAELDAFETRGNTSGGNEYGGSWYSQRYRPDNTYKLNTSFWLEDGYSKSGWYKRVTELVRNTSTMDATEDDVLVFQDLSDYADLLSSFQQGGTQFDFSQLVQDSQLDGVDYVYYSSLSFEGYATVVNVSLVPVPAAVWMFGSALGLLAWIRRNAT